MANTTLLNGEFQMNTDDKNLEIFSLIWLDENVNIKNTPVTEKRLRSVINHLTKFENVKQCQQFIENRSKKDRLILIVNDQLGQEIVSFIHDLRQVMSIYVYCTDETINEEWTSKFGKVKSVITEIDELILRIKEDHIIQKTVEEPLSINTFTTRTDQGKSTTELNGEFVFSQLLIDCLLRLKYTQKDKNELISFLETEYKGNTAELKNLYDFKENYLSDHALWWYTRDTFYYKTLNAALRTQNIHMIFLFRDFISDIQRELQCKQVENSLQVYRSQLISIDELDDLKQNIDQYISVNSFFSASKQREVALFFLGDTNSLIGLKLVGVLFEIDANPDMVTTKPFADISKSSNFDAESEVLFMVGSIFRLKSIDYNETDKIWIIKMNLCSDNEFDLKQVFLHMKKQIGNKETDLQILGNLLWNMGKLNLAEKYFIRLINEYSLNGHLLASLYEDLGKIASQKHDYDMSMQWYQKSLEVKKPVISSNTKWKREGVTIAQAIRTTMSYGLINCPFGLCSDNDQNIYIVDYFNHRIVEWKSNTTKDQVVVNIDIKMANEIRYPTDVLIDKENNCLIMAYNLKEQVVRWSLEKNTYNEEIIIKDICCYGLAMDKDGSLYVSDSYKNEVKRWKKGDLNGTIVAGGNGKGNNLNQLNQPTFIFVDDDYSLYVSDTDNRRVIKWLKDAKEGIVVAGAGNDSEDSSIQLSEPHGIIVDQLGQIYVADSSNATVIRWSKGAQEGTAIVGELAGYSLSMLRYPAQLSFDREGNLYVLDRSTNQIQKFEIVRNRTG